MSHQGATYERAFGQEDTNDFEIHYSRNKDKILHAIHQAAQAFSLHVPQHVQYDRNTIIRFIERGAQELQGDQQVRDFVALAEVQYGAYPTQYPPPPPPPPPPTQDPPPLVLSYEPTGQEALAERIDYLGNIIDGTSSVGGSGAGSAVDCDLPPQEQQPRSQRYNERRRKHGDDRAAQTSNPSAGGISNFEPEADISSSRSLPARPSDRLVSPHNRRRSRGGYHLLQSQSQELEVPAGSSADSDIDQYLRSQQSWNHGGLSSYTSFPSQAPRPMAPPSVTHSTHHSPLYRKHKTKRSRPSNSQPTAESVAGTVETASVAGSDRTCHTCTIEFPFPRDLKFVSLSLFCSRSPSQHTR